MMELLTTFAALSMVGTVILSLLPEGGIKRTASMAVGLLTLICWAKGIAALFDIEPSADMPESALVSTALTVQEAAAEAAVRLASQWEGTP